MGRGTTPLSGLAGCLLQCEGPWEQGSKLQCFIRALWCHQQPLAWPALPSLQPTMHTSLAAPHHLTSVCHEQGRACCAPFSLLRQHAHTTAAGWTVFNYPLWTSVHNNQQLIANNQTNWWSKEGEKSDRVEQGLKQELTPVIGTADGKQLFGVEWAWWKRGCSESQSMSSFLCPWSIFTLQLASATPPPL